MNGDRRPDADARRAEDAATEFIFALFFRLVFDGVETPDLLTRLRVESRDAATKRAAFVLGIAHHHNFFAR